MHQKAGARVVGCGHRDSDGVVLELELAYQLVHNSQQCQWSYLNYREARTGNKLERLCDVAAEFLGIWHLNVGHLCCELSFGPGRWVRSESVLLGNTIKERS